MATFTVNRDVNAQIGPLQVAAIAGATHSVPDDLFDEVEDILERSPGVVVTLIGYDRAAAESVYSVDAWGAVGDNVTDDTAIIQAGLDALVAGTFDVISFQGNSYKITDTLTLGLAQNKTIRGVGRDTTRIIQHTDNIPIFQFTAENTFGLTWEGMSFEYSTQQTSADTDAICWNFDKAVGTGSGWYYWKMNDLAFRKSAYGLKVTGTGQLPIFNFESRALWFQDTAISCIDQRSPDAIGSMPWAFIGDTIVTNDGVVPTAQAFIGTGVTWKFDTLTITDWYDSVLYANGGSFVTIDVFHLETHIIDSQFARVLGIEDAGYLMVRNASVTLVVNDNNADHWFALVGANANIVLDNLYFDVTNTSGSMVLLNCSALGASAYVRGLIDANDTVTKPVAAADLAARANVLSYEDDGFASYLLSLAPVSYYRFGESAGTAAKDVQGVQDGVYVNAPALGAPGLVWNDPNTGVALNGSDESISIADIAAHRFSEEFTIFMCLNIAEVKNQVLVGTQANSFYFELTAANALRIVRDSVAEIAVGTVAPAIGVPQQVAWTRNGSGTDKIYLNGADVTGSVTATAMSACAGMTIGQITSSLFFHGTMDEFALFDAQLTAAQMARLFALGRGY